MSNVITCHKFLKFVTCELETIVSNKNFGIAKIDLRCSIVIAELTGDICLTSSHLEYASITNRKVWPKKGPAKSAWRRSHDAFGNCHG